MSTWYVRNFRLIKNVRSEGFQYQDGFKHSISLSFDRGDFKVNVVCQGDANHNDLKCDVTFFNCLGNELFRRTTANIFHGYNPNIESTSMSFGGFEQTKNLLNDSFFFICKFIRPRVHDVVRNNFHPNISENNPEYLKSLQEDLKKYSTVLSKEKVEFRVGEETATVSKAVLFSRLPVFNRMFRNDTRELRDKTDIKIPVLKVVLSFLSTGFVFVPGRDFEFLCHLYRAAVKYDIRELHETCIKLLLSHISPENIPRVLKLSLLHNDELLKSGIFTLVNVNMQTLESISEWRFLIRDNPQIASFASKFFDILK
ncbi:Speckle-type POZ protein like [Argiope bruennichi]|uniref:Speckle-type POZ protein like n=1 Tax=Argiope bruennichi TaxID=94029 RepID=A0A8T0ECT0_ARGBR|nr:Speckle-type POZ protein like [Argiope bruennichi]